MIQAPRSEALEVERDVAKARRHDRRHDLVAAIDDLGQTVDGHLDPAHVAVVADPELLEAERPQRPFGGLDLR